MGYRIYELDPMGRIADAAELQASNDLQILAKVAGRRNLHGIEIWQGQRQVASLSPTKKRLGDLRGRFVPVSDRKSAAFA